MKNTRKSQELGETFSIETGINQLLVVGIELFKPTLPPSLPPSPPPSLSLSLPEQRGESGGGVGEEIEEGRKRWG